MSYKNDNKKCRAAAEHEHDSQDLAICGRESFHSGTSFSNDALPVSPSLPDTDREPRIHLNDLLENK